MRSHDRIAPLLHHTETVMFAKTAKILVAALMLAGASIAFVANASAAPAKGPIPDEINWMNRPAGRERARPRKENKGRPPPAGRERGGSGKKAGVKKTAGPAGPGRS